MSKQNELLPVKNESLNLRERLEKYVYLYDILMIKLEQLIEIERVKQYEK